MHLNLPILDHLSHCKNLLIAGMGGGFDIFCGLPIYFELQDRGINIHLASLTHSSLKHLKGARRLLPTLVGISATTDTHTPYFPELHLMRWFKSQLEQDLNIWCFEKMGVRPLIKHYETLVDYLSLDGILLLDGGVDSLIRGDELEIGSPAEDVSSIAAVSRLDGIQTRLTACLGLGAELEITYSHVFENIAFLSANGGFLGSCALTKEMPSYQFYEEAALFTQAQPRQDTSVINSSIISAVRGHYDNYHLTEKTQGNKLWISPLMSLYWFFDLLAVAHQNMFLAQLMETQSFEDILRTISDARSIIPRRAKSVIRLQ
jgi:hypothetical protein